MVLPRSLRPLNDLADPRAFAVREAAPPESYGSIARLTAKRLLPSVSTFND